MRTHKFSFKTFLFLLPAVAIFATFVFWPIIYTVYLSFFDWNMIRPMKEFVGFENYINVLSDSDTYRVLGNTLFYILILIIFNFVFPYITAFVLRFLIPKFKDFFKSAYFIPSFISMVVGSIIYNWILNPTSGPITKIMGWFSMSLPNWSVTDGLVILVISYITAWKVFGYNFITLYAEISGIDLEVIEAAQLDNVPSWKLLTDIVIPMTSSTGLYVFIMSIVTGLQYVYTPIANLTQGGPAGASSNLIYESYHNAFVIFDTGYSSAFSVITLLLFSFLLFIQMKFSEKGVYYAN